MDRKALRSQSRKTYIFAMHIDSPVFFLITRGKGTIFFSLILPHVSYSRYPS